MTTIRTLPIVLTLGVLSACAAPGAVQPSKPATATPPASAAAPAPARALRAAPVGVSQYLRIQAQQTGLVNVVDDGRNTYVAFARPVSDDFGVWDADGKVLQHAAAGSVAAIAGVHKGLLIRVGTGNSFVAPNPRATPADRPSLDDDPEVQEALSRLEGEASQMGAFRRALDRVNQPAVSAASSSAAPVALPAPVPVAIAPAAPSAPAADDPTFQRLPNGGAVIRIFFATGSRAIVRPEDGLNRLEVEARTADEIHVTGYTDNTGSIATNTALSQSRAHAIRALLIARGVPVERISVAGLPASQYLADNLTEKGRALNRRVEVQIVRRSTAVSSR